MWLKQFDDIKRYIFHGTADMGDITDTIKAYNGTEYNLNVKGSNLGNLLSVGYNANIYVDPARTATTYQPFIYFGSGTTPVTTQDYALASAIAAANITPLATSVNHIISASGERLELIKTCINKSSTSFTVNEWGIIVWPTDSNGSNYKVPVLVYREVLEEGMTVDPTVIFDFTANIDISYT